MSTLSPLVIQLSDVWLQTLISTAVCRMLGVVSVTLVYLVTASCPTVRCVTANPYFHSCLPNVGGRKCDTCLPGHHSFPYCQMCDCDPKGTEEGICDQVTSQCLCKVSGSWEHSTVIVGPSYLIGLIRCWKLTRLDNMVLLCLAFFFFFFGVFFFFWNDLNFELNFFFLLKQ